MERKSSYKRESISVRLLSDGLYVILNIKLICLHQYKYDQIHAKFGEMLFVVGYFQEKVLA